MDAARPEHLTKTRRGEPVTFLEAVSEALFEEMERDDRVFLMGEDIGVYGGAFKVTRGFLEHFGERRVIDTPIAEGGFTGAAAGAAQNMPADFRVSLVNPPGRDAYPIAGFTWLLVYKNQRDEVRGKALVNFLWWAIHQGQKYAPDLLYAPLPSQVVRMVEKKIQEISYRGKPLLVSR